MSKKKLEPCYKVRFGDTDDPNGSEIVSPSGKTLKITGAQSFKGVLDFVEEINNLKPSYLKAWKKKMAWKSSI